MLKEKERLSLPYNTLDPLLLCPFVLKTQAEKSEADNFKAGFL